MKLHEVMTTDDVRACHATTTLAEAATMMWERDCGAIPVVDDAWRVVGMITDRDICIAVATRAKRASEIRVGEVANVPHTVHVCHTNDNLKSVLKTMQDEQVRRLPVIDADGVLRGIISISDIVRHAKRGDAKKIIRTLKALCTRHNDLHEHPANSDDEGHRDSNDDLPSADVISVFET